MAIKSSADKIQDATLRDHINILRLSETEKLKAERLLVNLRKKIIREITSKDPPGAKRTSFQRKRLNNLYESVDKIVKDNFDNLSQSSKDALIKMGNYEAGSSARIVNGSIGVEVMSPELSLNRIKAVVNKSMIDGKLMKKWWERQADEFIDNFKDTMDGIMADFQIGMLEGRALGSMITSLSAQGALMGYTRRNVEAMIRTSFMQVAADVRQTMYDDNSDILKGTKWVSTLDRRTTPICRALDNSMWDMDGNPIGKTVMRYQRPPAHWNCRSTTVPITLPYNKMLKERPELKELSSGQRASMDGPVSKDLSYGQWLKTLPVKDQIDILGKARQELWKKGKLSMVDMIKTNGNPLTVKELQRKVNRKLKG